MIKAIEFLNEKGYMLRGFLDFPDGATEIVVMLHGFTGNKTEHNGHFRTLSRMLSKEGVASLRMDYHGNGESDGEFYNFIFEDAVSDGKLMIDYARSLEGIKKVDLLGFSMGGAIAGLLCNYDIHKLILWSAAGEMNKSAEKHFDEWQRIDDDNVYSSGFILNRKYVDSIIKFDMYSEVGKFENKAIIVQGDKDLAVNPKCAETYHSLIKNSILHFVKDAGHGYNALEQMKELYNVTVEFIKK